MNCIHQNPAFGCKECGHILSQCLAKIEDALGWVSKEEALDMLRDTGELKKQLAQLKQQRTLWHRFLSWMGWGNK